ncbi:50S ribosomal protein L29 [Blattabacterium cuenoti]|uniref:50S ribosomal protein L29 n=1 Tax=Blattabacterium cuenoti TaxID=1653831 RepID=UPI00163C0BBB|nr:50S ribosomal protein L29 [Blattabacterium cuenoti]
MKYSEIILLSNKEVENKLEEYRKLYKKVIFNHTFGLSKNPLQILSIRKIIARLNTKLHQKKY